MLILQHPRESDVAINTARLAELGLEGSELRVGLDFSTDERVQRALSDVVAPPIILYPGPEARPIEEAPRDVPLTLVVLDGTWAQSKQLLKHNPVLSRLPRYALRPTEPSRYRIRRAPVAEYVCTAEAIAQALTALEPASFDAVKLLAPFEHFVEQQLTFARDRRATRHRHRRGPVKLRPLPPVLGDAGATFVALQGEASAWPRGTEWGPYPEVVHVVAERLGSGERFEARIRPRRPLAPAFSTYTGIERQWVLEGEPFEDFVARWARFSLPTDVLCSWGLFAVSLLHGEGLPLGQVLDLREAARHYLRASPGEVEQCCGTLGAALDAPWAPGRTGRRLMGALCVLRALVQQAELRTASP